MSDNSNLLINIIQIDEELTEKISKIFNISKHVAGIISKIEMNEIESFLNPKLQKLLPNPDVFVDMNLAVDHLYEAIINKKKISILADYDVDGISSASILKIFLKWIGIEVEVIIPDRFVDGYGPNNRLFQEMHKNGTNLIITLDCGTVSFDSINFANSLSMKVIVIDHHISDLDKPNAVAVINPNRKDCNSGSHYFCAAGVTFMTCVALNKHLKEKEFYKSDIPNLLNLVHFVAIATICDMMKIIGCNRAFYSTGMQILNKNIDHFGNISEKYKIAFNGIKALMEVSGLSNIKSDYEIGFILGPMINAGGRIKKGIIGLNLLTSESYNEALNLANELKILNNERKLIQEKIIDEISKKSQEDESRVIFHFSEDFHEGIIGIVASKIKDLVHKPVIIGSIIEQNEIKMIKASCRSIDGINIGSIVLKALSKELIIKGGGHAGAAGFTCLHSKYKELKDFIEHEIKDLALSIFQKKIDVYEIPLMNLNESFARDLIKLEPFGIENPRPNFLIEGALIDYNIIKEKHYRIFLKKDNKSISIIFFNCSGSENEVTIRSKVRQEVKIICNIGLSQKYGIEIIGKYVLN